MRHVTPLESARMAENDARCARQFAEVQSDPAARADLLTYAEVREATARQLREGERGQSFVYDSCDIEPGVTLREHRRAGAAPPRPSALARMRAALRLREEVGA